MPSDTVSKALSIKPTKTLYHYTTQQGLLGIIPQKEIWATHTQYLNDQREYRHATGLVTAELERRIEIGTDPERQEIIRKMIGALLGIESVNVCVCSFSEESDSLSQWRAYGGPTSGYAIGFNPDSLLEIVGRNDCFLAPCIYQTDKQHSVICDFVEEMIDQNLSRKHAGKWPLVPSGGFLPALLHRFAAILKDNSYAEEREWRIISRPLMCMTERFSYRQGCSSLIPYYRIPIAEAGHKMRIDEIVIGPTPNADLAIRAVKSILVKHDLGEVTVVASKVPYRNW
jgi:hypothetical protein